ncbi:DgyrCDS530 [Dimorphilus gyrociliatus]|uniref:DgyrCDS530 n=1 Tax=Dimorphilus gyrociliatus TaxID=2664684 RepID=A0A7I8V4Q7_9ANNE|nr:DgyrCDS530 [Dimorphilus gyrociliatus]
MNRHKNIDFLSLHKESQNLLVAASCLTYNKWSTKFLIYDKIPEKFSEPLESNISDEFNTTSCCGEILEKGKFVVGDDDGNLALLSYDKSGIMELNKYPVADSGLTSLITDSNNTVICGSFDGHVKVFLLDEERMTDFYDLHLAKVCSIYSLNSTNLFCSTSLDGTCLLVDRKLKSPAKVIMNCPENPPTSVWAKDSSSFIIGTEAGTVQEYDLRNGAHPLKEYFQHNRSVTKVLKHNNAIVSSAEDGCICTIKKEESRKFAVHTDIVTDMIDVGYILSCGWDGKICKFTEI